MPAGRVLYFDSGLPIWRHCFCLCTLCCREWTAAVVTQGPYECPDCHQMSGSAVEWYEAPPMRLGQLLTTFPMEG